jgi:hypothetical protein
MNRTVRCRHCEDVIGVYEPMIVLCDGRVRDTSRATEPNVGGDASEYYHRDCYVPAHGEDHSL